MRWIKTALNTLKVFVLFVGCTLLFYYGMTWVDHEYKSYHKYDEPEGRAVKVSQESDEETGFDWLNRMRMFYRVGE